ncbi:MAG TPA: DUF3592 domain-containing protein [Byssovorax sp.]|jgi:hypothetical protein
MEEDDPRRARILASNLRWRVIFAILAVVVPALLTGLFARHQGRLRALVDHGQTTTATLTGVSRQDNVVYSTYRFDLGLASFESTVSREDAPYPPGTTFPITYLPEDPSLSKPFVPYTEARFEAEVDRRITTGVPIGFFVFFAGAALLCHRAIEKQRRGRLGEGWRISPDALGRIIAALLVATPLMVAFDPKVRAVDEAVLGPSPLGLPAVVVASIIVAALLSPMFWVMPHLARIMKDAQARGGGYTKFDIAHAVFTAPRELRRSRAIVLGGLAYFIVVCGAWIAFTSAKGI